MQLLRARAGVAALEFALVGAALMMLLLGTIQVGLLWWTENGLQITAMLTARCVALGSCTDPRAFAVSTAGSFTLSSAVSAVSVGSSSSCTSSATSSGHFTTVTITSTLWSGSVIPALSGASIRASACYPAPAGS